MSTDLFSMVDTQDMFQIKAGLFPLTTLQLMGADLTALEIQLNNKIQQAPHFFRNAPIILDLKNLLPSPNGLDFKRLKEILRNHHLIPVGVKNASGVLAEQALAADLPLLQASLLTNKNTAESSCTDSDPSEQTKQKTQPPLSSFASKVITEPVRSGQQIRAPQGDLIVLSGVSHGAELLADGHIHIYGPLRGRALAGINGNTQARIFCQSLEAELISIAGRYKVSEDLEQIAWKIPAEISFKEDHLHIRRL